MGNHQSFFDIFAQLALQKPQPGYVAKEQVKYVWGVGYVADVILSGLFVQRDNSKDKSKVFNDIQVR